MPDNDGVSDVYMKTIISPLTVSAGLNRSFDVANALDCDTVLVVAVHELVLELANLVNQNTEFVGDI